VPTEPAVPSDGRAWSAYLALGDSVVTATDLASPTTQGYPALLASHLEADAVGGAVELLNLARNGETTASMLRGGQLDAAVQQLQARNGNADQSDDIGVITLHIGGNDAFALIQECSNGLTLACLAVIPTRVETLIANLDAIVGQLRSAAGPDATLILGTYYNPLVHPGCMLHELAGLAETLFEGAPPVMPSGLNDLIRAAAAMHGGRVAEASGLSASELLPDCMHPAADGHRVIADAFIAAYAYG
jgi:lysophospholipase L1-like esterase